jgi:1-phosphofructokinase family hexose kinase
VITCVALSASLDVTYVVDSLTLGSIHRPQATLKLPGGKALNVARAAARLGERVRSIAVLGGSTGELMRRLIEHEGVETDIVWTDSETRSCVTIASEDDGRLTEIYERPAAIDRGAQAQVESALEDVAPGSWLVLAGSVHENIDLTSLGRALARARRRGVLVALDTHGAALRQLAIEVEPDLVKVNRSEAAEFQGNPAADPDELAGDIRARTGGLVVVTDGAGGAVAVGGDERVRSAPVAVAGPYPVGSGDCFLGGFLTAAVRGLPLDRSMAVASACAASNAAVPGAAIFDPAATVAELDPSTNSKVGARPVTPAR